MNYNADIDLHTHSVIIWLDFAAHTGVLFGGLSGYLENSGAY